MADGQLRILHIADSHIGLDWPARPRHDRQRRGDDVVRSYQRVLERARELDVGLVIHAGDVFDRSSPNNRALVAAAEPLLDLAVGGTDVVIVPGNHERSAIPGNVLLAHPRIHVIHQPTTLRFDHRGTRLSVSAIPCLRRNAARLFTAALTATGWADAPADVRILAVHQTFEAATCGPGNYRFRSGDDVVERSAIPAAFDYVAAGHVHRYQVLESTLDQGPPIVYAGSPDRISFAEMDEPKGCVLVEIDPAGLRHTFLPHEVRPMRLCPMDVTGLAQGDIANRVAAILRDLPVNAVAQLRFSGKARPGAVKGIRFAQLAQQLRPDVLLTASTRAVEVASHHTAKGPVAPGASAFARLRAPNETVFRRSVRSLAHLPTRGGVYALYDNTGRLFYVGKAANIRTRVRSHVRGQRGASFFRGWAAAVATVEARLADSELEALLIEADLVRRLRPPFNQRMRRWTQYCYLAENGLPYGQLLVQSHPATAGACFGPFRSRSTAELVRDATDEMLKLARCPHGYASPTGSDSAARLCERFHRALCAGPCAGRIDALAYRTVLRDRDALLSGRDDNALNRLERQAAPPERVASSVPSDTLSVLPDTPGKHLTTLRAAFDHARTTRHAEALRDGLLLLPGAGVTRKVAILTVDGLHLASLVNCVDAETFTHRYRQILAKTPPPTGRLPIAALDTFALVVQHLRRHPDRYHAIPRPRAASVAPDALLTLARQRTQG